MTALESAMQALADQLHGVEGARLQRFLRVMRGKEVAVEEHPLQEASQLYFPGLTARPWWDPSTFAWVGGLEQAMPQIRAELEAALSEEVRFSPYEDPGTHDTGYPGWDVLPLYVGGEWLARNADRCPATARALRSTPHGPRQGFFSRLRPGAHIKPHTGGINVVLTCHLPLVVPEGCGIRVGEELRPWDPGRVLIFDDSFVHEAWNRGKADRVVLVWDIWHPELTELERKVLARLDVADRQARQGGRP
jgi:aspartyl/asparaginyl beta-hydroxylase (cupin superfamily)